MLSSNIKTPGIYINEVNAFPNSVVGVPTAVPAFIGYTAQALYQGKSYTNLAYKISSFKEFKQIYCLPDAAAPANPSKQYSPQYYLVKQNSDPTKGKYILANGSYYAILPDPATIYYLYNSIRIFYENGGGDAYIVSVGTYGKPTGKPINMSERIINANVKLTDLSAGIKLLLNEQQPTLYICPEATLLSANDNATLMKEMLLQCNAMQTAMCIFDVIGGNEPDPVMYTNDIENFRNNTGDTGLKYGMAYYPFICSTIMQMSDIDYTNLFAGDVSKLVPLLNPPDNPNAGVASILANMQNPKRTATIKQLHNSLIVASPLYQNIVRLLLAVANILPPSGAMAGVITSTDRQRGVWKAPANVSMFGVEALTIYLSDSQQANLNIDVVSGKSINAIRLFNGQGILVWGARTLDGNSQDWKYISVRRTLIFLEQSCKLAIKAYTFQPNDKNTWEAVKAMIISFLTNIWKQGGLQGASPKDAFSVSCGLNTTMTAVDILHGYMNVMIEVAVTRPAEFIVITIQERLAL
jgi:uncharacterized protein